MEEKTNDRKALDKSLEELASGSTKIWSEFASFKSAFDQLPDFATIGQINPPVDFASQQQLVSEVTNSIDLRVSSMADYLKPTASLLPGQINFLDFDISKSIASTADILLNTAGITSVLAQKTNSLLSVQDGELFIGHSNKMLSAKTLLSSATMLDDPWPDLRKVALEAGQIGSSFTHLYDASLGTVKALSAISSISGGMLLQENGPAFDLTSSVSMLSLAAEDIFKASQTGYSLDPSTFLFRAPTIEPYSASMASALLSFVLPDTLDKIAVPSVDRELDKVGDDLYSRFQALGDVYASVYLEGMTAFKQQHHGWMRHAGVSFRELLSHILRDYAPDSDLDGYFVDPDCHKQDGDYTRNARLIFIYREVNEGEYARMVEEDIKSAQATFFPANAIVHKLEDHVTEKQMRILVRRYQSVLSLILEALGH